MRITRTTLLAGAAALLAAGTAAAAADKLNTMQVAVPEGGTVHIEYSGDVAPKVTVEQAPRQARAMAWDPFAELDRMAYEMRARHQAMMRQVAALQQAAAEGRAIAPGMTLVGNLPAGAQVRYFSSTTDGNGCTQTVQYSSDGSGAEPQITRASSGSCDTASRGAGPIPAAAGEAAPVPQPKPRKLDDLDV